MVPTIESSGNGAPDGHAVLNIPIHVMAYTAALLVDGIAKRVIVGLSEEFRALLPAMVAAESDRLCYSLDQLADATTLSRRTLESYLADGTLVGTRIGRRLVILPESARAFIRSFHLNQRGVA